MSSRPSQVSSPRTDLFYPCQSMESLGGSSRGEGGGSRAGRGGFRETPMTEDMVLNDRNSRTRYTNSLPGSNAPPPRPDQPQERGSSTTGEKALDRWERWHEQSSTRSSQPAPSKTSSSRRLPPRVGSAATSHVDPSVRTSTASSVVGRQQQQQQQQPSSSKNTDMGTSSPPSAIKPPPSNKGSVGPHGEENTAALASVPSSHITIPLSHPSASPLLHANLETRQPQQRAKPPTPAKEDGEDAESESSSSSSSSSSGFAPRVQEEKRPASRDAADTRRSSGARSTATTLSRLGSRADSALHHLMAGGDREDHPKDKGDLPLDKAKAKPATAAAAFARGSAGDRQRQRDHPAGRASDSAASGHSQNIPKKTVRPPSSQGSRSSRGQSSSSYRGSSRNRDGSVDSRHQQRQQQQQPRRQASASPSTRSRASSASSASRGGAAPPTNRAGTTPPRRRPAGVEVAASLLSGSQAPAASNRKGSSGSVNSRSSAGTASSSGRGRQNQPPPPTWVQRLSSPMRSNSAAGSRASSATPSGRSSRAGSANQPAQKQQKQQQRKQTSSQNSASASSARRSEGGSSRRGREQERPPWQDVAPPPREHSSSSGSAPHSRSTSFGAKPQYNPNYRTSEGSESEEGSGSRRRRSSRRALPPALHEDGTFDLATERRASVARRHHEEQHLDPLAAIPPQELQRIIATHRGSGSVAVAGGGGGGGGLSPSSQPSHTYGISRLDLTQEEDLKELFRQTYIVDPLLQRRPGKKQFVQRDHIGLTGVYGMWGENRPSSEAGEEGGREEEEEKEKEEGGGRPEKAWHSAYDTCGDGGGGGAGGSHTPSATKSSLASSVAPPSQLLSTPPPPQPQPAARQAKKSNAQSASRPSSARPTGSRASSMRSTSTSSNRNDRTTPFEEQQQQQLGKSPVRARPVPTNRTVAALLAYKQKQQRQQHDDNDDDEEEDARDETTFVVEGRQSAAAMQPDSSGRRSSAGGRTSRSLSKVGGRFTEEMAELDASRDHDIFGVSKRIQTMMEKGKARSNSNSNSSSRRGVPVEGRQATASKSTSRRVPSEPFDEEGESGRNATTSTNEPFVDSYVNIPAEEVEQETDGDADDGEHDRRGSATYDDQRHYSDASSSSDDDEDAAIAEEGDDADAHRPHHHRVVAAAPTPQPRGFREAPVIPLHHMELAPAARAPAVSSTKQGPATTSPRRPKDHDIFGRNLSTQQQQQQQHGRTSVSPTRGNRKNRESQPVSYLLDTRQKVASLRGNGNDNTTRKTKGGGGGSSVNSSRNSTPTRRSYGGSGTNTPDHPTVKSPSPFRQQLRPAPPAMAAPPVRANGNGNSNSSGARRAANGRVRSVSASRSPRRQSANATSPDMRNVFRWKY